MVARDFISIAAVAYRGMSFLALEIRIRRPRVDYQVRTIDPCTPCFFSFLPSHTKLSGRLKSTLQDAVYLSTEDTSGVLIQNVFPRKLRLCPAM